MADCPQDVFLARVRESLCQPGPPVELPDDVELARVIRPRDDVLATFLARAEEAKMHAHRVAGEAELVAKVAELVAAVPARSVLVPAEDVPAREAILARLREKGVTIVDPDDRDAAFHADVGITGAEGAVAETASVWLASGGGRRRLAGLAVPVHIAVVRAERIVPDLIDWAARHTGDPPANEVLVSGPSKTADIELELVIGVHGPKEVHVVVLG